MAEVIPPATAPSNGEGTTTTANTTTTTTGGTSTGTNGAAPDTDQNQSRGLPYYDKLRRELRDTLQKKRLMDKSMAQLEDQIYHFEQSYLEETSAGNIIKGFDNYIKGSSGGSGLGTGGLTITGSSIGGSSAARRKVQVLEQDRVFSRSSASFMCDSPTPSSAQTTPSHAPTPTSTHGGLTSNGGLNSGNNSSSSNTNNKSGEGSKASSSKNKKKFGGGGSSTARDSNNKDKDDDGDADIDGGGSSKPPAKRLKISYGRE